VTGTSPLVNLAARRLGASVLAASDEFFGEKENLLRPEPPSHRPGTFGHKGQLVDGWETRRHGPGEDYALIRLGAAGVIERAVVDTAHFTGNFPDACSVHACAAEGYPSPAELAAADWVEIVPRGPLAGDCQNVFAVTDPHRFTHLRLTIYPDGGWPGCGPRGGWCRIRGSWPGCRWIWRRWRTAAWWWRPATGSTHRQRT